MLIDIFEYINSHNSNPVLCIDRVFYAYSELFSKSVQINNLVNEKYYNEKIIGVVFNNDLATFASIISIWASGKTLVILDNSKDFEYNYNLVQKTKCRLVLSSSDIVVDSIDLAEHVEFVNTEYVDDFDNNILFFNIYPDNEFFLTFCNVYGHSNELIQYKWNDVSLSINSSLFFNFKFNSSDKFLSFFDFSHPLSIYTFFLSLKSGACFFTIPSKINRAYTAYSVIDEYQISFSFITPYALKQLEPFFEDISLWSLKYLLIVGDFLFEKIASKIIKCASNAYIFNVGFSPFIFGLFSAYEIESADYVLAYDKVVSLGKPFDGYKVSIINSFNDELRAGEIGEMVLKNNNINYTSLYNFENDLLEDRVCDDIFSPYDNFLYKTELIGFINDEGMIIPVSSVFKQIIFDNIPIDSSVLEKKVRQILKIEDVISITYKNIVGYEEIHLFVQNLSIGNNNLFVELQALLPEYLLPTQIHNVNSIPVDINCFIDYFSLYKRLNDAENSFIL